MAAGTFATSSNANVYVERFGNGPNPHFTLRNTLETPVEVTFTLNATALGLPAGDLMALALLSETNIPVTGAGDTRTVTLVLPALAVEVLYLPAASIATNTPTPTPTVPTNTPTPTPTVPTNTPTPTPTVPTNTPTPTPTVPTNTPTPTPTVPTNTPTPTPTVPTNTPTPTSTQPSCRAYDLVPDGFIDLADINTVLYNSIFYNAPYNARYDLAPDGVIDTTDIYAVALYHGETCP